MMLSERVQVTLVNMKVTSDEEIIVDRMIAASQRKGEVALPSFGRDLVPYFVPGAEAWNEGDVNVNTDLDSFRREGASVLDIPLPASKRGSQRRVKTGVVASRPSRGRKPKLSLSEGQERSKGGASKGVSDMHPSLKPVKVSRDGLSPSETSPTSPFGRGGSASSSSESDTSDRDSVRVSRDQHENMKGNSGKSAASAPVLLNEANKKIEAHHATSGFVYLTPPGSPEARGLNGATSALPVLCSPNEKWAGPAYANSPPPSCLPLPRFALKNKEISNAPAVFFSSKSTTVSGFTLPVHSAPTSPAPAAAAATSRNVFEAHSLDAGLVKRERPQHAERSVAGCPRRMLDMDGASTIGSVGVDRSHATQSLKKLLQIL